MRCTCDPNLFIHLFYIYYTRFKELQCLSSMFIRSPPLLNQSIQLYLSAHKILYTPIYVFASIHTCTSNRLYGRKGPRQVVSRTFVTVGSSLFYSYGTWVLKTKIYGGRLFMFLRPRRLCRLRSQPCPFDVPFGHLLPFTRFLLSSAYPGSDLRLSSLRVTGFDLIKLVVSFSIVIILSYFINKYSDTIFIH